MILDDRTLFKTLDGLTTVASGTGYRYPGVGRWTKHLDPTRLEHYRYGYHLTRGAGVVEWLNRDLFIAEPCPNHPPVTDHLPKLITCRVKLTHRFGTWNDRTARLFAADCAEDALALIDTPDPRSVQAIEVARRYVNGDATDQELAAAWAAAWAAAGAAAWAAAGAAARDAAWAAAGNATGAAAGAAAKDARDSQYQRLINYLGEDK